MNDMFTYSLSNNDRVMTLWQGIETQLMYEQEDWFSDAEKATFENQNYGLVDVAKRNELKEKVSNAVRTALKTQLWDKFDEDQCDAFIDLAHDYVFIGNGVFHSYFILFMSNEHLSFDAFCIFMREWVGANADILSNMSIQERNSKISKKVADINNYLIGNRFSDKLMSAMQISLTVGFNSKAALEMQAAQKSTLVEEDKVVWRVMPKQRWSHHAEKLVATLPYAQAIVTMPTDDDDDFMTQFNTFCSHHYMHLNEGSLRSLVTRYMWQNLEYLTTCETLGEYCECLSDTPNGMLGILIEHVTHSFKLIVNKQEKGISFSVGRMNLATLSTDENSMLDYIRGYADAIKWMYNELTSYRDEIMAEIINSHLIAISYCHDNGLQNYDFDALIEKALKQ